VDVFREQLLGLAAQMQEANFEDLPGLDGGGTTGLSSGPVPSRAV
jgi:hypothetical protein